MREQLANDALTTLAAGITVSDTSIVVSSRTGFPEQPVFRIRVDDELLLVTAGAGTTTWTVERGIETTTPAAHSSGAQVAQVLTAGSLRAVIDDVQSRRMCEGRLTLVSGQAIPSEDAVSSTLHFTPFMGRRISLNDSVCWKVQEFTELSASVVSRCFNSCSIWDIISSICAAVTTVFSHAFCKPSLTLSLLNRSLLPSFFTTRMGNSSALSYVVKRF